MSMPSTFVLATRNAGKVRELAALLPGVRLLSLDEVNFIEEIEEPHETFGENALAKAMAVYQATGIPAIADDSGLVVDALGGAPGVRSARWAGPGASDGANIEKLLRELGGEQYRRAAFVAVLCVVGVGESPAFFEGRCEGYISESARGGQGFGYDPVFVPTGSTDTFAELAPSEKSALSHRGKAAKKLAEWIEDQVKNSISL